jgi:8-oxo-dGTP pyrophosphatase MutT (NUDIX family)
MVGSSILPVTIHNNKLFFLFGKEANLEDTPGWSDFGGGVESGESIIKTALREGAEELTGFLGNASELEEHIKKNGGYYHINHNDKYHVHVIYYPYDENLPKYYNQNHHFLWKHMNPQELKKTKLFEKIEIKWFSPKEMENQKNIFRSFYQEIVDHILQKIPQIKQFCKKEWRTSTKNTKKQTHKKTQKNTKE